MKTYHLRVDGVAVEVAVEEVPADSAAGHPVGQGVGVRITAVRRLDDPATPGDGLRAGRPRRVDLAEVVPGCYSFLLDGRSHTLVVAAWRSGGPSGGHHAGGPASGGGAGPLHLLLDGIAVTADIGRSRRVRSGGPAGGGTAGQVRAPMPGLVVAIQAGPGTAVVPGQPLIIMEAMKMQMEIRAPHAGVVREVRVSPGQDVAGNDLLVTVD
ncbi:MAG TPA: acetyl-CoA carboxylase biotin carboxyl carrier protein subunit [bacterium]|nr:acetyl-CoA carboxylase biotin carboxyl carrier protein subunit [bacterium]